VAGRGVWALVFGQVVRQSVLTLACTIMQPWRPRGRFSRDGIRKVLGFGARTSGGRVAWYLYSNADYLVVGKLLGQQALGFYTLVFEFATLPADRISSVINQVAFPVYSELQDRPEPFKRFFLTAATLVSLVTFPLMLGLLCVADVAVARDAHAGMAADDGAAADHVPDGNVAVDQFAHRTGRARPGRPGLVLRFNLICLAVLPVGFVVGSRAGLAGVCWAWVILFPIVAAVWFQMTRPLIGYAWRELAAALAPAAACGATMTLALALLRAAIASMPIGPWKLAILVIAGAATYGLVLWFAFRGRVDDIREALTRRG